VHTAPEKENRRRKRSRSLSLDRLQGPNLNLNTTKRNHYTGPHSAVKVDHSFAASDIPDGTSFQHDELSQGFSRRLRGRGAGRENRSQRLGMPGAASLRFAPERGQEFDPRGRAGNGVNENQRSQDSFSV
jgi:hypothetical protein